MEWGPQNERAGVHEPLAVDGRFNNVSASVKSSFSLPFCVKTIYTNN